MTSEQERLKTKIKEWYQSGTRQWYSYSGAAGTGKTTIIRAAIEELGIQRYICCAYVGKAVSVLAQHGLPASTIHSMIYNVTWTPVIKDGVPVLREDGNQKMKMEFVLKDRIKGDPELIIVDEATMVNDELCNDILSFGIKTVFIGDNNQLPPVFGVSSVMMNPDFWLTKIMRQAENDPIIYLSQKVLKRERIDFGIYGKCKVMPYVYLGLDYTYYDMIITPKNAIRDMVNDHIRKDIIGIESDVPVLGDRLICRQNNWDRCVDGNLYLTTGMTGTVTDIDRSRCTDRFMTISFQPDIANGQFLNLQLDARYIKMGYDERKLYGLTQYEKFEYGYCITAHQSQGSQAPNVLFNDQWFYDAELTKRVRYTSITRAQESVTIASEIRFYV